MLKWKSCLEQLNSDPFVLLVKLPDVHKSQKVTTRRSSSEEDGASSSENQLHTGDAGATMQRYQIVKKSSDPRDQAGGSLNLRINLNAVPAVISKRKASLEDALADADSAYEKSSNKKSKTDGSSSDNGRTNGDSSRRRTGTSDEGSRSGKGPASRPSSRESDRDNTRKQYIRIKTYSGPNETARERETRETSNPSPTNSSSTSGPLTRYSKEKSRLRDKKRKRSSRDRFSPERSSGNSSSKGRTKHYSSSSRKQSDTGDGSQSDEELAGNPSASSDRSSGNSKDKQQDLVVSVSLRPPGTSADDTVTDEEVFDDTKEINSALALIEDDGSRPAEELLEPSATATAAEEELPRSDSDVTAQLDPAEGVGNLSRDDLDLASAEKSVNQPGDEEDDPPPDLNPPSHSSVRTETPDDTVPILGSEVTVEDQPDVEDTPTTPLALDTSTHETKEDEDRPVECEKERPPSSSSLALENGESVEKMEADSELVAMDTDLEARGDLSDFLPWEDSVSMEASSEPVATLTDVVKAPKAAPKCCWPIDLPSSELDKLQEEMLAELADTKAALKLAKEKRRELEQELRQTETTSQTQRADADARKVSLEEDEARVSALAAATERCRATRSHLQVQKKKSHQDVLGTEIRLRELQVVLCRYQLEVGNESKPDEPHPLAEEIEKKEAEVAELTAQVEAKTRKHREAEEAFQKAELEYQAAHEEHEALAKHLSEGQAGLKELYQGVETATARMDEIRLALKSLLEERRLSLLRTVELDEELIKMDACRKLQVAAERKQKIMEGSLDEEDEEEEDEKEDKKEEEKEEEMKGEIEVPQEQEEKKEEMNEMPAIDDEELPSTPKKTEADVDAPSSEDLEASAPATVPKAPSETSVITETPPPGTAACHISIPVSANQSVSPRRPERPTSVIVNSPPIRPTIPTTIAAAILPSTPPPTVLPSEEGEASMADEAENSGSGDTCSPQPICLRVASPGPMIVPASPATPTPGNVSSAPMVAGSPSCSATPSPSPIRLVDSLASPSSKPPTPAPDPHGQQPQLTAISLSNLESAVPFYAQFLSADGEGLSASQISDHKLLYQEVVNGCRRFVAWATNFLNNTRNCTRDAATLHKSAGYIKDYLIPFYRLLLHRDLTASALLELIVQQAAKSNFYGMPAMDVTYLKQLLENNLRLAIDIGTRYKDRVIVPPSPGSATAAGPPSRVEFSPSSGSSSLPTFTIHPPAPPGTESYVHPTPQQQQHHQHQQHQQQMAQQHYHLHHSPALPSSSSSPIGALNSMVSCQGRPSPVGNTNGVLTTEVTHPGMHRQGWNGGAPVMPGGYPSPAQLHHSSHPPHQQQHQHPLPPGVQQNTAVVVPMQFGSRHGHPLPPQPAPHRHIGPATQSPGTVPTIPAWPHQPQQQQQQQQQQQYHMMQPGRMYHAHGPQQPHPYVHPLPQHPHYRPQPQPPPPAAPPPPPPPPPPPQQPYIQQHGHYQQQQQQQLHVDLSSAGSNNLSDRGSMPQQRHLSSRMEAAAAVAAAETPQHRMRQHSASGQPQHSPVLAHSHPGSANQLSPQQRHLAMSAPVVNPGQLHHQQRHFSGTKTVSSMPASCQQQQAANAAAPIRRASHQEQQPLPQQPTQPSAPVYTCLKCGKEAHQKCSGCQTTFYCSRACQVAHWDEHGKTCSKP